MKILLVTVGSRGDVLPMLVLARELLRRDHAVELAAPPNFANMAEAEGLPFIAMGADTQVVLDENQKLAEQHPLVALPKQIALLERETARQIADLFRAPRKADLVVGAGLAFGGPLLAEKLDAAYAYVCYTLAGIRSREHPPAAMPLFGLPTWGNQAAWWTITRMFDATIGKVLRAARVGQGLRRDATPWQTIHASETLLAQDELLAPLPGDALGCRAQVPALVHGEDRRMPLPDEIERFLAGPAHQHETTAPPCTYVGFGSMPTVDRERLLADVVELHRATGTRVIVSCGQPSVGQPSARMPDGVVPRRNESLPPGINLVDGLDHASLFPRMGLVVHHGGAGTTATALRAGAPQLVVPHIVDQFFHGRRIAELGLGMTPVPKAKLTAAHLIGAFATRKNHADAACTVAAKLAGTTGAALAVDYLEGVLARRPRS